ncbi:MAG: hypothetical protein Q8Q29_06815 [Actinomycetota bacterium]|nr:hypothetical protein [Actinomycetota bacterium]
MRLRAAVLVLLFVLPACGDDAAVSSTASTTTPAEPTTVARPSGLPAVLSVVSGRGDDGTIEVAVWFDSNPLVPGAVLIVGIDADDSYTGAGDVRSHLDGFALFTPRATAVDVSVSSGGEVVADPITGDSEEWVSWGIEDEILRVFFVRDVATRSGTVWVLIAVGDESSPLGTAGVPLGDGCSHVGSGFEIAEPPGGVPDEELTCLYE